jgi:hypothetical protein
MRFFALALCAAVLAGCSGELCGQPTFPNYMKGAPKYLKSAPAYMRGAPAGVLCGAALGAVPTAKPPPPPKSRINPPRVRERGGTENASNSKPAA